MKYVITLFLLPFSLLFSAENQRLESYKKEILSVDVAFKEAKLEALFDSKVALSSQFEGLLAELERNILELGKCYLHFGVFTTSKKKFEDYGYAAELGVLDIADSGFFAKYALIGWNPWLWDKKSEKDYSNSQLLLGYENKLKDLAYSLYTAALLNHKESSSFHWLSEEKVAWYSGLNVKNIRLKGIWALDMYYQYVLPKAVANSERRVKELQGFVFDLNYQPLKQIKLSQSFSLSKNKDKKKSEDKKKYSVKFNYLF